MIVLDLNDEEKRKIAKTARINKFPNARVEILYEKDSQKKIELVVDCIRLLMNLKNNEYNDYSNITIDDESDVKGYNFDTIKKKIGNFLNLNKKWMREALLLHISIPRVNFGKTEVFNRIDYFIVNNQNQITYMIDFVYELGKRIEQYDPDQTQGYY